MEAIIENIRSKQRKESRFQKVAHLLKVVAILGLPSDAMIFASCKSVRFVYRGSDFFRPAGPGGRDRKKLAHRWGGINENFRAQKNDRPASNLSWAPPGRLSDPIFTIVRFA